MAWHVVACVCHVAVALYCSTAEAFTWKLCEHLDALPRLSSSFFHLISNIFFKVIANDGDES
jgi:hypothetical protein